jgi:hypothetical protein
MPGMPMSTIPELPWSKMDRIISRVIANRRILADISGQGEREVSQSLKMDAIASNLASPHLMHQQQVELLE